MGTVVEPVASASGERPLDDSVKRASAGQELAASALGGNALNDSVKASRTGLQLAEDLSWERWRGLGGRISAQADASNWWLGDWLVFGEARYGTRYTSAIASTGLEYKTLRNYAMVARRFKLSRRRDTLSFAHHAEICALDDAEQDHWLGLAEQHRWSRGELRRQLQTARTESESQKTPTLRLIVNPEHTELWRRAAAELDCEFEGWVLETLDSAARRVITGAAS